MVRAVQACAPVKVKKSNKRVLAAPFGLGYPDSNQERQDQNL